MGEFSRTHVTSVSPRGDKLVLVITFHLQFGVNKHK